MPDSHTETALPIGYQDVLAAAEAIGDTLAPTPAARSRTLSTVTGADIYLKFEIFQFTASFKERGALNRLLALTDAERARGVVAMSAGNHAQGVAYHAARLSIPATIVMPHGTPFTKVKRTEELGARVVLAGDSLVGASEAARQLEADEGLTFIPPFDDALVMAGQGTVGKEFLETFPELEVLVVPIGGGGLISGVAVAAKAIKPDIRVVGVQTEAFPAMKAALEGQTIEPSHHTLAEGIAVKMPGELTRRVVGELVEDILVVSESRIEDAINLLMEVEKVVVEGAGAAGLMAAIEAGRRGRAVLLLEQAQKPAQKIRISGGGRCNFTNLQCGPGNFLSENPRFCVSALKRYSQRDFIAKVEAHGIAYHEKTLGQLFCDGASQQIIDMLLGEAAGAGVALRTGIATQCVAKRDDRFHLTTSLGAVDGGSLVVATGGPSIPKMGASGFAYDIARQFGLAVVTPRPALVPLTFDPATLARLQHLTGVAAQAVVACGKARFEEALLFTHRGLSGPAILQISSYWAPGQEISCDLLPGRDGFQLLRAARGEKAKQDLHNVLSELLPRRLAQSFCREAGIDGRLADLSDKKLRAVAALLKGWRVRPSGTEGFRTAEVTAGGIDTAAISSKTFEARTVPGLYFIGECLDVTGHLGGHNFQWAWSSGHAAGQVA